MTIHKPCAVAAFVVCFLLSGAGANADVQISTSPTRDMTCSGGTCTPTAKAAVLNANDLAGLLASGDVTVASSKIAPNIEVNAGVSWTSSRRLTLDAYRSIFFRKAVTVAGPGALTLRTADGDADGDFSFSTKGHVRFWDSGSSLIINGNNYVLANSLADLAADFASNLSGLYALAKNYDASQDGTYSNSPIDTIFGGTFEGLGNTISGFSLRLARNNIEGGLIACACPGAVVRDIKLQRVNVQGADNADVVGALAGLAYGNVIGASVSGSVRGSGDPAANDTVGGLLGESHGLVANSHSSAKVSDAASVGGLVGFLVDGGVGTPTILNSSASGTLSGRSEIGGLVGQVGLTAHTELVENSFATGAISASSCDTCGGLAGSNNGAISNSYATGSMKLANCSACGGLIGTNTGKVATSYSVGAVTGSGGFIGGLIGKDSSPAGSIANTYWDLDTSGVGDPAKGAGNVNNDPGINGLSDAQLKAALPQGFDKNIWKQKTGENGGYPYLSANPPSR